jgi:prepilin-type N-terminal cleavage/methylation domain-containing protein
MRPQRQRHWIAPSGFTLMELLMAMAILGILAGISVASFARNWNDERLKAASRETTAWLDEVRRIAIQKATPCRIRIDSGSAQLSLDPNAANAAEFCAADLKGALALRSAIPNTGALQLCSSVVNGIDPATTTLPCSAEQNTTTQVVFTPRGTATTGVLIQLNLPDTSRQRCIAVLAPLGQIRSGKATSSGCDFTTAF